MDADNVEAVPGLHQPVVGLALPLGGHELGPGLDPGLGLGGHVALHVSRQPDLLELNSVNSHAYFVDPGLKRAECTAMLPPDLTDG